MEKSYLVEAKTFKENAIYSLQKILPDNFHRNFNIWSAILTGACIYIGHRAKVWTRNKFFPQILFPVRSILRKI